MANDPVRALRVTPDGVISDVTLPPGAGDQLSAMCAQIGCSLVEPVDLGDGLTMWCDEEGLVAGWPAANLCATGVAARRGLNAQPYVGTVLFTGLSDAAGEIRGLTEAQAVELRRECEHVVRYVVAHRLAEQGRGTRAECEAVQRDSALDPGMSAR